MENMKQRRGKARIGPEVGLKQYFNQVPEDIILCVRHAQPRGVPTAEEMEKR